MGGMFSNCTSLKSLTFGEKFAKKKTSSAGGMFFQSNNLRFIDFSKSTYSASDNIITNMSRADNGNMFSRVPSTTVIYLPTGSPTAEAYSTNIVYTKNGTMVCERYYSADKVDIELPHAFKANKAEYYRGSSNTYGTVILPYAFTSNYLIQCYNLTQEHTKTMYFEPTTTVPAHKPFLYKTINRTETRFNLEDTSGNYGITVRETKDTELNEPYMYGVSVKTQETVDSEVERKDVWAWWGYYVTEETSYEKMINRDPDFDYSIYYIANNKFYHANSSVTVYPHRTVLLGNWNYSLNNDSNAPFLNIGILGADGEEKELTAIESAELFNTVNGISAIYDVQGRRLQQMQPGLNIVHMEDGRILKVKK